ncbi:DoxX family protein [Massilia sp. Dwa41.01b]|uniref:DoxX family protein n=1 Tax=unclassified Massilia TaxID=2609279 RepID=UPI001602864D|nr:MULTISPECIES: DoxX family protein [unclassified Massilia]QNA87291.1 DoxX family protein [Massilia sp. Dwa41.01b]QNA98196.1 DoxX family protein [Massilia sp. Se16.2.3]
MNTQTIAPAAAKREDLGKLLLRVVLAILLLFHGFSKLSSGIGFVTGALAQMGLPAAIGYLVYVGEIIAPLLILFGIWTRPAALIVAGNMVVAVLLVHTSQFFTMSPTGGWALELQGMYFIAAIAVALLGAGRYSVGGRAGKWN